MARKKKSDPASVQDPVPDSACRCENALQEYWCKISVGHGFGAWCIPEEETPPKENVCLCENALQKYWCEKNKSLAEVGGKRLCNKK